ncbi:MAG TPA: choice-of-anchor V domain-containing protein [Flavobacteriales bacterium]|nr:choice-of-anchor V domain-containing protein [Flavobacteriales bacterium]
MYKTFFILLSLGAGSFLLMSDDTGVATETGKDRTGSPFNATGGQQCNACHSGGSFSSTIDTRLKDTSGAIVTEYLGGATYTYEVEVTSTAPEHGFQAIALISGSNANAGTLNASSSNAKIKVLASTRRYAEQTAPSATGLFVMTWIAPAPGSGTVNFYACGNAVNGNGLKTGDDPTSATVLTISESPLSGIGENASPPVNVYPNPVSDFVYINPSFAGTVQLLLTSIDGKTVNNQRDYFVPGFASVLDVRNLPKGTYILSIVNNKDEVVQTTKIIK